MDLSFLHHQQIAVVLQSHRQTKVLTGRGHYDHDVDLGRILRIHFSNVAAEDGFTEFTLREDQWNGVVTKDEQDSQKKYRCDYVIRLAAGNTSINRG